MDATAPPPPHDATAPAPSKGRFGTCLTVLLGLCFGLLILLTAACDWISTAPAALTAVATIMPYLWAVFAALTPALLLSSHQRFVRAVVIGILIIGWIASWGRAWMAWPAATTEDEPLRVMSWNVQRLGYATSTSAPRFRCVVDAIEAADPHVLALLEVTAKDIARLSPQLDLSCEHIDYLGTGKTNTGGLAACTRGGDWKLARRAPRRFVDDSSWFYMFAELERGDRVFNLLAVHLQPYRLALGGSDELAVARAQSAETDALLLRLSKLRDPTIVAGDFNSPRDTSVHHAMRQHLTDAWEQAGWGPGQTVRLFDILPMRIDYIYTTDSFGVNHAEIPPVDWTCSDHRPVVTHLSLTQPQ